MDDKYQGFSRATFNSTAEAYDDPALSFWERFANETLDKVSLKSGDRVLDLCCGTGASALIAAQRVSPTGEVIGIDIAEKPIERARDKAAQLGITNVEFNVSDFDEIEFQPESFDVVVCIFGLFFMPDMVTSAKKMWSLVKPGGQLVLTVWTGELFEPADSVFWEMADVVSPGIERKNGHPMRLIDPTRLKQVIEEAGIENVTISTVKGVHQLSEPADFWKIVLGTGKRFIVESLSQDAASELEIRTTAAIAEREISEIAVDTAYAIATK